jgi:ribosomal protein L29
MKSKELLIELRKKDPKALLSELKDLNSKLTDLQFKSSFRRLKNFHEITQTRKRIARIWTILGEKMEVALEKEDK